MKKFLVFLVLSVITVSCAWADTPINSSVFTDNNFMEFVRNFDINHDSILQDSEIALVTEIRASNMNIASLDGIEAFTSLKTLMCHHNSITQLDLSANKELIEVSCGHNPLTSLNISGCAKLSTLFCTNTNLNVLDVSKCANLEELYCYVSSLDVLDVSANTKLVSLDCQENNISVLNLTANHDLEFLDCGANKITSLNLSNNPKIRDLYCRDLDLSGNGLNVSNLENLRELWCWNDGLTELDVTNNKALHSLLCYDNNITELDLSGLNSLVELLCDDNPITESIVINNYVSGEFTLQDVSRLENIHSSNIIAIDSEGNPVTFLGFDANEMFASAPALVKYDYSTGLDNVKLTVTAMTSDAKGLASCTNGIFDGVISGNIITWKGIPYAKQPVNSLRWKAPQAPDVSNEIFDASSFAPTPIQYYSDMNPKEVMPQGEECLALNVWNNGVDLTNLKPVMVWIHGGAFNSGGTANPDYDMQGFIEDHNDVVVVSVGYRVGMMGFIDFANSGLPGTENYVDSGNLGLLDIIQALRWLRQNIKAFGGDPENITLFGQSSGASSIALIMSMPEATGLFKRAITQSGSVSMTSGINDCLPLTQALVKLTGAKSMNDLLELSSTDLQEASEKLQALTNFPERDGIHIAENPFEAFAQNSGNFEILAGTMADEINYWALALGQEGFAQFIPMAFYQIAEGISKVNSADGEIPEKFVADYMTEHDDATELEAMCQFLNDLLFRVPALTGLENYAGKKYLYYWTRGIPGIGACHALDIPYVLNSKNTVVSLFITSLNHNLAKNVQSMWINFAKTGNPSESWPEYDTTTRATMLMSNSPSLSYGHLAERYAQVSPLMKYGFSGRELISAMAPPIDLDPGDDPESPDIPPDISPDVSPDISPDVSPDISPNISPDVSPDVINTVGSAGGGCNSGFMLSALIGLMWFASKKKS